MKAIHRKIIEKVFTSQNHLTRAQIAKAVGIKETQLVDIYFNPLFQRDLKTGINYLMTAEMLPDAVRLIRDKIEAGDVGTAIKFVKDGDYFEYADLDSQESENSLLEMVENGAILLNPKLVPDEDIRKMLVVIPAKKTG